MTDNGISIREFFERLMDDHAIAHKEHQAAHDREHVASQKAIDTAATLAHQNKMDANEWRATMSDRERHFVTREWAEGRVLDNDRRLLALERSQAQMQGALDVARFVGFGGLLTALGTLI